MSAPEGSGWLGSLVPQPGPRDPAAAAVWQALDEPARRRLRRTATDPDAAAALTDAAERTVVADLAASRASRHPFDVLGPLVTGLLVLSTVWGFGRAVVPTSADWWLLAGLVGLVGTTALGLRRAAVRRRGAEAARRAAVGVSAVGPDMTDEQSHGAA